MVMMPKRRSTSRFTSVSPNSPLNGKKCSACRKIVRPGQRIKYRRNSLDEAPAYDHYLVIHVDCMGEPSKSESKKIDLSFRQAKERFTELDEEWANVLS